MAPATEADPPRDDSAASSGDPWQEPLDSAERRRLPRSSVLLSASDPVIIEDLDQNVIDLNESAERAYGWSRQELIGRSVKTIIPAEFHDRSDRARTLCRRREPITEAVWLRKSKAGDRIPVTLSLFPIVDEHGQVVAIGSIAKDISAIGSIAKDISELERQKDLRDALRSAEDRAEERERRALARDLHDSVAQLLTLARIRVSEARDRSPGDGLGRTLDQIDAVLEEVDKRVRTLMFRLNPSSLYELGLAAAAEELAEDLGTRYDLSISVEDDGSVPALDDETRTALFRGMRELLINVARHAGTNEARVRIGTHDGEIVVDVEDEGVGFDGESAPAGFGLVSVRDRLERCGGNLDLHSVPGDGTRARMTAQLAQDDHAADHHAAERP
jgi:PAS domain S-box-containing protein